MFWNTRLPCYIEMRVKILLIKIETEQSDLARLQYFKSGHKNVYACL